MKFWCLNNRSLQVLLPFIVTLFKICIVCSKNVANRKNQYARCVAYVPGKIWSRGYCTHKSEVLMLRLQEV